MPKTKQQKQEMLQQLANSLDVQQGMIFIDFKGLKVKDLGNLRKQLKNSGNQLTVVKKTLLQKSLQGKKILIDVKELTGQIAVVFAKTSILEAIKIVHGFAKTKEQVKLLAGYMESTVLTGSQLQELALLPSKEELLAKLVRTIANPMSGFLTVLQGNIKGLLYVLAKAKT